MGVDLRRVDGGCGEGEGGVKMDAAAIEGGGE